MSQKLRPLDEIVDVPDYMRKYCSGAWHIDSAEQFAVEYNALTFRERICDRRKYGVSTCCASCLSTILWRDSIAQKCYRFFKSARREARACVKRQAYIPGQDSGHHTRVFARLAVGLNFLAVETKCRPSCPRWSRSGAQSQIQSQALAKASTASKTTEQEEALPSYEAATGLGRGC
ncbi:hypothetical protein BO86DRAFT_399778 [Aspergillus japonicus CBS 114.51]|uniref:Uncharacterized protein n=1 Tax=Aspergillus japonicus CBS 114.51 TaxID=1448312 RepID=A0A8T8X0M4_ASPJA|nr:hypothetical protein BO86DRAFT_399778 [Aspergillus japonicus CBS 114.51]RAH81643.1 hypothetical protein BO86DRAFT_399778 [Aspergillus japonicus CBS 114.51]